MIISKIELLNFGPYYDKKTINFSNNGKGVHIIRGENGQGKTSLQNAIIWALYGRIYDRNKNEIKPTKILNHKAKFEDKYVFGVKVYFSHDGSEWILGRKMKARTHHNKSYRDRLVLTLTREGDVIPNPQQEIERILPERISRFFFFDGETLEKYEMLLDESNPNRKYLKESIEAILGLPYLSVAKLDLEELRKKYDKEVKSILRRIGTDDINELTDKLEDIDENISILKQNIEKLQDKLDELKLKHYEKRKKLLEFEKVREMAKKRDDLKKEIETLKAKSDSKMAERRILLKEIYKYVLIPVIKSKFSEIERIYHVEYEKHNKKISLEKDINRIKEEISSNICQCCGRPLDSRKVKELKIKLEEMEKEYDVLKKQPIPNINIYLMKERLERLIEKSSDIYNFYSEIKNIERDINNIESEIMQKETEKSRLSENISETDEEEAKKIEFERQNIEEEIGRLKERLDGLHSRLSEYKKYDQEIRTKLKMLENDEIRELNKRKDYIEYMIEIFEEATELYRTLKRKEVEQVATDVYKKMKTKEGFKGLEIDENYGLKIVTEYGEKIGLQRSAGEEQIVALALIGALNQCSFVKAPVFADTALARLDENHTKNVLEFISSISDQIVLLVTNKEFKGYEKYLKSSIVTDLTLINKGDLEGTSIEYTRKEEVIENE